MFADEGDEADRHLLGTDEQADGIVISSHRPAESPARPVVGREVCKACRSYERVVLVLTEKRDIVLVCWMERYVFVFRETLGRASRGYIRFATVNFR